MALDWAVLRARHDQLIREVSDPAVDHQRRAAAHKELSGLAELLRVYDITKQLSERLQEAQSQRAQEINSELVELFDEEIRSLERESVQAHEQLEELLYPPDERDSRSAFLEIRAGVGGQEAALFVADLLRMYTLYAQQQGWRVSIASESPTELKGYREIVLHIEGKNVYGALKKEAGVHRVQRVPSTEASGRVHTSTVTIVVLPESPEAPEITINPADLRIDVYRASGAGGQHVNRTDSAVRVTHIPTGIVVACQEDRSQHKNRARAMKVLQARLDALAEEKQRSSEAAQRRDMIGSGMRSEKVRTYNFPQNRVTDHQAEITLNKLDRILEGDLDEIIMALKKLSREERRTNLRAP